VSAEATTAARRGGSVDQLTARRRWLKAIPSRPTLVGTLEHPCSEPCRLGPSGGPRVLRHPYGDGVTDAAGGRPRRAAEGRPLTAHASATDGVALISVPALGAIDVEHRVREAALDLIAALVGESRLPGRHRPGPRRQHDPLHETRWSGATCACWLAWFAPTTHGASRRSSHGRSRRRWGPRPMCSRRPAFGPSPAR
jgi:hypothetical protein